MTALTGADICLPLNICWQLSTVSCVEGGQLYQQLTDLCQSSRLTQTLPGMLPPCKHLLAVINSELCGGWTALPAAYRSLQIFSTDPDIAEHAAGDTSISATTLLAETPSAEIPSAETPSRANASASASTARPVASPLVARHSAETVEPTTVRLQSQLRQLLSSMINCTYSLSDVDFLQHMVDSAKAQLQVLREHIDPAKIMQISADAYHTKT